MTGLISAELGVKIRAVPCHGWEGPSGSENSQAALVAAQLGAHLPTAHGLLLFPPPEAFLWCSAFEFLKAVYLCKVTYLSPIFLLRELQG